MNPLRQLSRRVINRIVSGATLRGRRDMVSVLPRDAIQALDAPLFVKPAQTRQMTAQERVIGVELGGEAKAYPINILSVHEIVNDVIGGEPVVITWSPLSFSAMVYRRRVVDRPLLFGGSGAILRNVLVMYDRQTETYWNQLTGDAFAGPLAGIRLESLPSLLTSWGGWLRAFPASQVLSKENSPYEHYEEDHMHDYYCSAATGIRDPAHKDDRLAAKEVILGVGGDNNAVAYPLSLLRQTKVLHDDVNGEACVAFYAEKSHTATFFSATVAEYTLTFYERSGMFYDYQTGSCWSPLTGGVLHGPLVGKQLQPISVATSFWFAWADHFPETKVYSLPAIN